MNVPVEQNVTGNKNPEIPDQVHSTALSIALNNGEVAGSLTGVNYTILDVGYENVNIKFNTWRRTP